jgi:serine/threonine-protein kinase
LLTGVLGLVYLGVTGFFSDLFSFSTGVAGVPTAIVEPSAQPTAAPTGVPMVPVPDLAGKTSQEASLALQAVNLSPLEEQPRFSDTISQGLVIDQFPLAGTSITQTSVVTFAVSLGAEPVEVPNVAGLRAGDAQGMLERVGFKVQRQEEASRTMDEGFVIRSVPGPETRPPRGDTITIFVSIGDKVRMPDVTGLSEAEAKQRINAAGLIWSFSDFQNCDKLGADVCSRFGPGQVVSSIPRGGELVDRGTTAVTLGVRAP